jgi:transposase
VGSELCIRDRNNYKESYNYITKDKLKLLHKYKNFQNMRNNLKDIKNNIINKSQLNNIVKNTKIQTHTLDYALRQLTSNIKSAITNIQKNNIKRFRIKYWNNSRPSKTIEIEKQYVSKKTNKICYNILGDIKYEYNKKDFILPKINNNVKINYNSVLDEYTLFIPIKHKPVREENKPNNIIVLDPGLRTFMTGLSENSAYKIASNINNHIKIKLKRLENIKNNNNIPLKIKKKNEKIINRKIYNLIDEMHWKVIKFLTTNFNNILLGNMSAKSIVKKSNKVLSPIMKTACLRSRYYEFNKRLEYKCKLTKTNLKLVNEYYTSKTCSNCGNYNDKLKGEKTYDCNKCNFKLDRDLNACRNIMFRSLI